MDILVLLTSVAVGFIFCTYFFYHVAEIVEANQELKKSELDAKENSYRNTHVED